MKRTHYERDDDRFPYGTAYRVRGFDGVACAVLGWETEPDEDTEWSGYEVRTGAVVVVMIGDDHKYTVDESERCAIVRTQVSARPAVLRPMVASPMLGNTAANHAANRRSTALKNC